MSIYDFTGAWVKPYIESGYPTMLWDYKKEGCILQHYDRLLSSIDQAIENGYMPYGLFSAVPCTEFAASGARHWAKKDITPAPDPYGPDWTVTDLGKALVEITLDLKQRYAWAFWVLENPVGRMEKLVPEMKPYRKMWFNPCDYGDAYTKKTILWGDFNTGLAKNPVEPEFIIWGGQKFPKLFAGTGGKSEKTKTIRSTTPAGFAQSFYEANK